jgi:hypothetical protein
LGKQMLEGTVARDLYIYRSTQYDTQILMLKDFDFCSYPKVMLICRGFPAVAYSGDIVEL